MNIGTIVDSTNIKVVLGRKVLGEVDDNFANFIKKGDSFNFSGISLECLDITSEEIQVKKLKKKTLMCLFTWEATYLLKESYPRNFKNFFRRQI